MNDFLHVAAVVAVAAVAAAVTVAAVAVAVAETSWDLEIFIESNWFFIGGKEKDNGYLSS